MATINPNFTLQQASLLILFLVTNLISAAYIPPRRLTRPQLDQDQTHNTHQPIDKRDPLPLPQEQDPNLVLEVILTATAQGLPTALPPIAPNEPLPSTVVYPEPTLAPYEPLPSMAIYPPDFLAAKRNPSPIPQDPQDLEDFLKVIPTPPAGGGNEVVVFPTPPPSPPPSPTPEPVVNPVPSPEPVTPLPPSPPEAVTPLPQPVTPLPPAVTPILEPVAPLPPVVTPLPEPVTPLPLAGEAPVFVTPVAAAKRTVAARVVRQRVVRQRVVRRKLQLF